MVPPDSQQIPRARCYSGTHQDRRTVFSYPTLTVSGPVSQTDSPNTCVLSLSASMAVLARCVPQPRTRNPCQVITRTRFSLLRFRSPLLTESQLFSLPTGTEMFHFPALPPHTLYIQVVVTPHDGCQVSPFGNPRISARLTAPRGISQPPTSFIGS